MKEETLKQICKMIASGEIPKEVYDKYLSKCPIGFMAEEELLRYLTQLESNWKELKKHLEDKIKEVKKDKEFTDKVIQESSAYESGLIDAYEYILERLKSDNNE